MLNFREFFWTESKLKLFGAAAKRVATEELKLVFDELHSLLANDFAKMELVRWLPSKKDHGDVDILVVYPQENLQALLSQRLGNRIVKFSKNGNINSVLYDSSVLNRTVHVDFIVSKNAQSLNTNRDYYAFGDLSAVIGILSKKMHFKYGTDGFFKRFQDQRTIWRQILITHNLMDGLKILGFSSMPEIKDHDDIIDMMKHNPMVNSAWFVPEELNAVDRQSANKRPGIKYICDTLMQAGLVSAINDEDHFFKILFPKQYQMVEAEKQRLNQQTYAKSNIYDGNWVMKNLGIGPGAKVGQILRSLTQRFGDNLADTPEAEALLYLKTTGVNLP